MELKGTHWSEGVAKLAVWLSGLIDFEQAAEVLERVGQIVISDSSIWRQVQKWGEKFQELEEKHVLPASQSGTALAPRMGVSMDGTMINIRQEGWKEVKVGCVFEVALGPAKDGRTGEMVELAHAKRNSYVAHLGGPERFGELVWAEARRRGWEHASDSEVVGDGAPWVWNTTATYFYNSWQVVDWYHATEHLWSAADNLYGVGTPETQRWFRKWETPLYQ